MLVTKTTTVEKSDKKYNISEDDGGEKVIPLKGLSGIPPFTRVTCEAKVVKVENVSEKMQNVMITDGQTTVRVTLWEKEVGKLKIHNTYRFVNIMMIREDNRKRLYLSTAKDNCKIIDLQ